MFSGVGIAAAECVHSVDIEVEIVCRAVFNGNCIA